MPGPTLATERARVSADDAQFVRPRLASFSQPGEVESLNRCSMVWGKLSDTDIHSECQMQALDGMAQAFMNFFQLRGRKLERMQQFEFRLQLPSVSEFRVRSWFGEANGFPIVDQLASIAVHGTPVHVDGFGDTDITAALAYNHHSSVVSHTNAIINKVHEDERFGRAFVSPLRLVN